MGQIVLKIRKGIKYKVLYDDCDQVLIDSHKWHIASEKQPYVRTMIYDINGKRKPVTLHNLILGTDVFVDHINHNELDNRRSNIRVCNISQNTANRKPFGKSKYKGINFEYNRWRARIKHNGKYLSIGRYRNEKDAAMAYDKHAKIIYKEFAYLNFK